MNKLLKLSAFVLGALSTLGLVSCGDDDDNKVECCTYTDLGDKYTFCADGTYTFTYTDGSTYSGNWQEDGYTWEQVQAATTLYGGSCS